MLGFGRSMCRSLLVLLEARLTRNVCLCHAQSEHVIILVWNCGVLKNLCEMIEIPRWRCWHGLRWGLWLPLWSWYILPLDHLTFPPNFQRCSEWWTSKFRTWPCEDLKHWWSDFGLAASFNLPVSFTAATNWFRDKIQTNNVLLYYARGWRISRCSDMS